MSDSLVEPLGPLREYKRVPEAQIEKNGRRMETLQQLHRSLFTAQMEGIDPDYQRGLAHYLMQQTVQAISEYQQEDPDGFFEFSWRTSRSQLVQHPAITTHLVVLRTIDDHGGNTLALLEEDILGRIQGALKAVEEKEMLLHPEISEFAVRTWLAAQIALLWDGQDEERFPMAFKVPDEMHWRMLLSLEDEDGPDPDDFLEQIEAQNLVSRDGARQIDLIHPEDAHSMAEAPPDPMRHVRVWVKWDDPRKIVHIMLYDNENHVDSDESARG